MKGTIETALRETREAFGRKDVAAASEKAETLKKLLKEAGAVIYSQTQSAGPYAETKMPGDNPPPYESAGEARPFPGPARAAGGGRRVQGGKWVRRQVSGVRKSRYPRFAPHPSPLTL